MCYDVGAASRHDTPLLLSFVPPSVCVCVCVCVCVLMCSYERSRTYNRRRGAVDEQGPHRPPFPPGNSHVVSAKSHVVMATMSTSSLTGDVACRGVRGREELGTANAETFSPWWGGT
ncbi:unnamed protein product [Protopolystoma xenopodis]|uniref:Uncharacterized protein n=1 Tax=Protopolystoma xenopodis TaxID=117903 RepID=A0A3S5AR08_9PLAT|nr:unnamed protein product [Protopolystoma xenopodis]